MANLARNLVPVLLLLGILYFTTLLDSTTKTHQRVCKPVRDWQPVHKSVRISAQRKVLRHFPSASVDAYNFPSRKHLLVDKRNIAVSRKGYFVIGFDNGQIISRDISAYDFYVSYSNDTEGSHFFLKAFTIRKAIEGCQKQVRFVYKDHDAILKPILSSIGFHNYKIAFQTEFHNSSANAGLVTGKASDRTKQIISEWDGASGIAQNLEKDQTVLRAFVSEDPNSFLPLPPNSIARHIYSTSQYRAVTIQKARLIYSSSVRRLRQLLTIAIFLHAFKTIWCSKISILSLPRFVKCLKNSHSELLIFIAIMILDSLSSCPMCLARSFGVPEVLNLGMYHPAVQLQADDMVRVWADRFGFHMGTPWETFRIPIFRPVPPILFTHTHDIIFIVKCVLPIKWIAIYRLLFRVSNKQIIKIPKL